MSLAKYLFPNPGIKWKEREKEESQMTEQVTQQHDLMWPLYEQLMRKPVVYNVQDELSMNMVCSFDAIS